MHCKGPIHYTAVAKRLSIAVCLNTYRQEWQYIMLALQPCAAHYVYHHVELGVGTISMHISFVITLGAPKVPSLQAILSSWMHVET